VFGWKAEVSLSDWIERNKWEPHKIMKIYTCIH
jgi:hypothetical protein